MGGFKARNLRFCSVREIGLLDERIIWYFKVKHIMGLLVALFIVLISGRTPASLTFSLLIAAVVVIAAIYPTRSVSLEALLFGAVKYSLAGKREKISVELKDKRTLSKTSIALEVRGGSDLLEEDTAAGFATRESVARKTGRMRRIS